MSNRENLIESSTKCNAASLWKKMPHEAQDAFDQLCEQWLDIPPEMIKSITFITFEALANELLRPFHLEARACSVDNASSNIRIEIKERDND